MEDLPNPITKLISSYLDWTDDKTRLEFEKEMNKGEKDKNILRLFVFWSETTDFKIIDQELTQQICKGNIIHFMINGSYHSLDDMPTIVESKGISLTLKWHKNGKLERDNNYPTVIRINDLTKYITLYWDVELCEFLVLMMFSCQTIDNFKKKCLKLFMKYYYKTEYQQYKLFIDKWQHDMCVLTHYQL